MEPITQADLDTGLLQRDENALHYTRRKASRYEVARNADWDFFTYATGAKRGYLENISQGGCLLRTEEAIEHRRWIRLIVRETENNLCFTSVGRVIRREDKIQPWDEKTMTLHRYGIEFIHKLNPLVLEKIQNTVTVCAECGRKDARIPHQAQGNRLLCVLCHLRQACHNLLDQDHLEPA